MLAIILYIIFGYFALAIAVEFIPVLWPLVELAAVILLAVYLIKS